MVTRVAMQEDSAEDLLRSVRNVAREARFRWALKPPGFQKQLPQTIDQEQVRKLRRRGLSIRPDGVETAASPPENPFTVTQLD
jgi:hypothetical protein